MVSSQLNIEGTTDSVPSKAHKYKEIILLGDIFFSYEMKNEILPLNRMITLQLQDKVATFFACPHYIQYVPFIYTTHVIVMSVMSPRLTHCTVPGQ